MKRLAQAFALALLVPAVVAAAGSRLQDDLRRAEAALGKGNHDEARAAVFKALERDAGSLDAWAMRARWAEKTGDTDELVYALHRRLLLTTAQGAAKTEVQALRTRLVEIDPVAGDLLALAPSFVDRLDAVAKQYEKDGRPHSAIRVHQEILALDPERQESKDRIDKLSSTPDPSLAETAKPKDLLEDYSKEYIEKRNRQHTTWKAKDEWKGTNYITHTDAGFEVLIRAANAMEQMNGFYREFFRYGTPRDGGSVPRIFLRIFKDKDEYLKSGSSPVEWSGGQFTGSAVETFIGQGGFEGMVGTLFHEAAHQFVSLATSASGWLNEGLASFFEGTRILANGTVIMNLPANHRLFPLASRMEQGWMRSHDDGTDPKVPEQTPATAPTFRIVLENRYSWGPPWYAPTWGVVYFLYNYQDPVDGRFVYRRAFQQFIDASGGLSGDTAVSKFEEVVLGQPERPTPGVDFSASPYKIDLPRRVNDLDPVWKDYILRLRDEQSGRSSWKKPFLDWGRYAIVRKDYGSAKEHFEKGLNENPQDVDLLVEFADLLASRFDNADRASKLGIQAMRVLEQDDPVFHEERIAEIERMVLRWDPKKRSLDRVREEIWTRSADIVQRYIAQGLPLMAMDVSWRFGNDLRMPGMFELFEKAARESGKTLALWQLAYNEDDLRGWSTAGDTTYRPEDEQIQSRFGEPRQGDYSYQFLTLDTVTSGDFSMEAEIRALHGKNTFCGLVFGKKGDSSFHSLIYFPGEQHYGKEGKISATGYVDLTTFYGAGQFNTWRHNAVETSASEWHKMRLDVVGSNVDVWFDDRLVVTQDFNSTDVLRGSFGLITGPGSASYRNVRYLSRVAFDPGAAIERIIRLEKAGSEGAGGSSNSYIGKVPPFPKPETWLQAPRTDWTEKGFVPTVLVFWSMQQNDIIPIDEWMTDLALEYEDIGLQVMSVVQADGADAVQGYLDRFPFPGSIAVDSRVAAYFGETFADYFIGDVYNLPRVILLDIDQKVAWEGDPGYSSQEPYEPGKESYLDPPLKDLIARRRLRELRAFTSDWVERAPPALARCDIAGIANLLTQARELPGFVPEVVTANRILRTLEDQTRDLEGLAAFLAEREAEPALEMILGWATVLEIDLPRDVEKSLKKQLKNSRTGDWDKAIKMVDSIARKLESTGKVHNVEPLTKRLETLGGTFPALLLSELKEPVETEDLEAIQEILRQAALLPARWLARERLGWETDGTTGSAASG